MVSKNGQVTRRCAATRADGQPCGMPPMADSEFCWAHDPANRERLIQMDGSVHCFSYPVQAQSTVRLQRAHAGIDPSAIVFASGAANDFSIDTGTPASDPGV